MEKMMPMKIQKIDDVYELIMSMKFDDVYENFKNSTWKKKDAKQQI